MTCYVLSTNDKTLFFVRVNIPKRWLDRKCLVGVIVYCEFKITNKIDHKRLSDII